MLGVDRAPLGFTVRQRVGEHKSPLKGVNREHLSKLLIEMYRHKTMQTCDMGVRRYAWSGQSMCRMR